MLLYNEILQTGFDGHHFIVGLSEHFRNLMVCQEATSLPLLMSTELIKKQYQDQAKLTNLPFLYQALHIIDQCNLHYKSSNHQRLHVELALIELAHILDTPLINQSSDSLPKLSIASKVLPSEEDVKQQTTEGKTAGESAPSPSNSKDSISLPHTLKLPQIDQLKKQFSQQASQATPSSTVTISTTPQLPLTKEAIMEHWQAYAQELKQAGKMLEYSLLRQEFRLEGSTIVMELANAVQKNVMVKIRTELMGYLRTRLQRKDIAIRVINVPIPPNSKPYTAQEKFRYLVQKYPSLELLQKKLLLEVQD